MNVNEPIRKALYGGAQLASLVGALLLLTGFLIAADWHVGNTIAMVIYLALAVSGTTGLFIATATFWSARKSLNKIAIASNVEVLAFASILGIAFMFDSHRDYSPMIVGLSRSLSISISSVAWFVIPFAASLIGTSAALLRARELRIAR